MSKNSTPKRRLPHFRPCRHCAKSGDCMLESALRAEIDSMPPHHLVLTTLSFRCPERWQGFEIGSRVMCTFAEWEEAWHDHLEPERCEPYEISGYVAGRTREGKIKVWLDKETRRGNRYVRIWPTPIQKGGTCGVVPLSSQPRLNAMELDRRIAASTARRDERETYWDAWTGNDLPAAVVPEAHEA